MCTIPPCSETKEMGEGCRDHPEQWGENTVWHGSNLTSRLVVFMALLERTSQDTDGTAVLQSYTPQKNTHFLLHPPSLQPSFSFCLHINIFSPAPESWPTIMEPDQSPQKALQGSGQALDLSFGEQHWLEKRFTKGLARPHRLEANECLELERRAVGRRKPSLCAKKSIRNTMALPQLALSEHTVPRPVRRHGAASRKLWWELQAEAVELEASTWKPCGPVPHGGSARESGWKAWPGEDGEITRAHSLY